MIFHMFQADVTQTHTNMLNHPFLPETPVTTLDIHGHDLLGFICHSICQELKKVMRFASL